MTIYRCSLREASTNLQKTILSASFLKQPTLCNQLLAKYIEFTTLLSSGPVHPAKPFTITNFEAKDFDMTVIDPDCSFKPIKITNTQSQSHILMLNIRLLTHISIEMCNIDITRSTQCTQCILNTFSGISNIEIKSKCLRYFAQLFKHTLRVENCLQPMIVWILDCIGSIESRITLWMHHKLIKLDDIEYYVQSVCELLDSQYIVKLFHADYLRQAINVCVKILQTHHDLKVPAYNKIIPHVYALIKCIPSDVADEFTHTNQYQFVKATLNNGIDFHKKIELLGLIVLEQMKNGHLQSWCLVEQKIKAILDHTNATTEMIINHMKCLCSIFKTVRFIEHSLTVHLQREFCNQSSISNSNQSSIVAAALNHTDLRKTFSTYMATFSARLLPQLDAIGKYVVEQFSVLLKSKYTPSVDTTVLLLFTDIAIRALSAYDANELDDYLQSQLMVITLCPFVRSSDLLYNHFQQTFDNDATQRLNRIMETPFLGNNDIGPSWQVYILQRLAGLNLKYISQKNTDIFMDILGQICINLKQPEYLDQMLNVLVSCVIQVNTYSIADYEKFIKSIANNPNNHLVISRHLSAFYCLSSGCTYIVQTFKNNTYPFKVVCTKCDSQFQFNGNESKVLGQYLKKTNGKFIRTLTTHYNIQDDSSHMNYFKLFKSNDYQIRANMAFCLPPIINHLDLARYRRAVDFWLSPIVDDEIDIRMWMINHMNIFPKCGDQIVLNKCLEQLLSGTKKFLSSDKKIDQSTTFQLIAAFATSNQITETMLLNCFRMIIYFCMSSKSMVSRQAVLRATEICYKFGITPKNLLVWYKMDIFKQIVMLCVSNYLGHNVGLQKSLQMVSIRSCFLPIIITL